MAALITEAKPRQLQVTRLRQEEEESWISSEELHTDGSSDEDHHHQQQHQQVLMGGEWPPKLPQDHHHSHHHHHHTIGCSSSKTGARGATMTPPSTASEPALQDSPHLTETTRRLSELGVEEDVLQALPSTAQPQESSVEEQEEIMLWRPKRGSIKLPHIDLSSSTSVSSESAKNAATNLVTSVSSSATTVGEPVAPLASTDCKQTTKSTACQQTESGT